MAGTRDTSALKRADIISGLGTLITGVGLGLLVPKPPERIGMVMVVVVVVVVVGGAAHAWGMWRKHALERELHSAPPWMTYFYGGCWLSLVALVVMLLSIATR